MCTTRYRKVNIQCHESEECECDVIEFLNVGMKVALTVSCDKLFHRETVLGRKECKYWLVYYISVRARL